MIKILVPRVTALVLGVEPLRGEVWRKILKTSGLGVNSVTSVFLGQSCHKGSRAGFSVHSAPGSRCNHLLAPTIAICTMRGTIKGVTLAMEPALCYWTLNLQIVS